ncbi:Methylosome protein 50 [Halotydeus destructor]|nr:Methylosome protein 50 [Halotydeus destructor]
MASNYNYKSPVTWQCMAIDNEADDGQVVVGSTIHQSTGWVGRVTRCSRDQDYGVETSVSLVSGCRELAVKGSSAIVGLDCGNIQVMNKCSLENISSVQCHDDFITAVKMPSANQVLTCSADCCIIQWDLSEGSVTSRRRLNYAHGDVVWDLDMKPLDLNTFITCGQDCRLVVWDLRTSSRPAQTVARLKWAPLACLWSKKNDHYVYSGSADGSVSAIDLRKPGTDVATRVLSNRSVFRLRFVDDKLAILSSSCALTMVADVTLDTLYQGSSLHTDHIRDVIWDGKKVISIGSHCQEFVEHHLEI